jgi:hypothetical protein
LTLLLTCIKSPFKPFGLPVSDRVQRLEADANLCIL